MGNIASYNKQLYNDRKKKTAKQKIVLSEIKSKLENGLGQELLDSKFLDCNNNFIRSVSYHAYRNLIDYDMFFVKQKIKELTKSKDLLSFACDGVLKYLDMTITVMKARTKYETYLQDMKSKIDEEEYAQYIIMKNVLMDTLRSTLKNKKFESEKITELNIKDACLRQSLFHLSEMGILLKKVKEGYMKNGYEKMKEFHENKK